MSDKKFLTLALIFALILNLVLLALNKVNELAFWIVIAVVGISAYIVLPKLKRKIH